MEIWKDALVDFGLLFAVSWGFSLCTFCVVVINAGKPWSLPYLLFDTTRGAGIGASVGLYFIEKIGAKSALSLAVAVSGGLVSKDVLKDVFNAIVYRVFGVSRAPSDNPPTTPKE